MNFHVVDLQMHLLKTHLSRRRNVQEPLNTDARVLEHGSKSYLRSKAQVQVQGQVHNVSRV